MVHYCCAYGCDEKFIKGGTITFHTFPKDESRRRIWEVQLKRKNFKATKYSKICSKHFTEDCFDTEKFGATWLKEDAIPTIFNFPENMFRKESSRKAPKKRKHDETENSTASNHNESIAKLENNEAKRLHYIGDFDEKDVECPTKAKKLLAIAQSQAADFQKKVKKLGRENERLKKKVTSLTELLSNLKKKNLISDTALSVLE